MVMTLGALMRDAGAVAARKSRGPSRQALESRARRSAAIPSYLADFRLVPGACRKRRCKSRFGIVRLSVDTRDRERIDTLATVECAACGRVWRRTRPPKLGEYQSTALTLVLPATERRWYARGRWHREGDDAVVVRDATQADLMAATGDWRKRNAALGAAKVRAAERKAAAERETHERTMATLARLAELDAARAADEAAAAAREG